jgi:CRISPR-associated endoribonuclease Cas6
MIEDEVWTTAKRMIELRSFDLRTVKRDGGHGGEVSGFVGTATLRTLSADLTDVFSPLLRFAPYCGTGAQATHGFGATTVTFPRRGDG